MPARAATALQSAAVRNNLFHGEKLRFDDRGHELVTAGIAMLCGILDAAESIHDDEKLAKFCHYAFEVPPIRYRRRDHAASKSTGVEE